ncbi:HAD family hydrolase [Amnibacterium kyonggiense]
MPALLFGSISSVADTSELQRRAFNDAFAQHGLDWTWDRDEYRSRLGKAGGRDRVAAYAKERGQEVDADAVHATKSALFQQLLTIEPVSARPGVVDSIRAAKEAGFKVGLVTTTSRRNVEGLLDALAPTVSRDDFDVVIDREQVSAPKPDAEAYRTALERIGEQATNAVAVEDNPDGAGSARAAGVAVIAFPNENTAGAEFGSVAEEVDSVDFADVRRVVSA